MRFSYTAFLCSTFLLGSSIALAQYGTPYDYVLSAVQHRNLSALKQFVASGYTVDVTNYRGETALCQTIMYKDYPGFELLLTQGANPQHRCTQRIPTHQRRAFMMSKPKSGTYYQGKFQNAQVTQKSKSTINSDWLEENKWQIAGWGAGIAGGVALIAAAGGGGGGSDNNSGGNSGDTPPTSGTTEPEPTQPVENFETAEYLNSKFLSQINASSAYSRGYTGYVMNNGVATSEKVKIGIVDTGVWAHDDLKANLSTGFNYDYGPCRGTDTSNCWAYTTEDGENKAYLYNSSGTPIVNIDMTAAEWTSYANQYASNYDWDKNQNVTTPLSADGKNHGTLVAGILAATKNDIGIHGVAPNAQIIPVRYDLMSFYDNAVDDLIEAGARVINFSIGIASAGDPKKQATSVNAYDFSTEYSNFEYLLGNNVNAFQSAVLSDTVLVFAAGNDGEAQPSLESAAPLSNLFKNTDLNRLLINVVAVGADNKITDYSTRCGVTADFCIAAPGGDASNPITTTNVNNTYAQAYGTSAAAPAVTGAVALLMGAYPHLSSQDVVDLLFETATDMGNPEIYGHGLLNLERAKQPVGKLSLSTGTTASGEKLSASQSKITLPTTYAGIVNALPQTISVLDKYERAFGMDTRSFIRTAHRNPNTFRNALHRFTQHDAEGQIALSPRLSFSFNKATSINTAAGVGSLDMTYQLSPNQDLHVFFTEDGAYGRGSFFDKPLVNPFSAMDNAYGFEHVYKLTSRTHFKMGFATGENGLVDGNEELDWFDKKQSYTFAGTMDYNITDNTAVGFVGGILREEKSLLGLYGTGGFETPDTDTYYMGITARIKPTEKLTLQAAYYYGLSNPQSDSAFMKTSRLISDSFAVDARYQLNNNDVTGIQFSSPLRIRKGTAEFDLPVGRDSYTDTVYREKMSASLKPTAREYDMALYYTKIISDALRVKSQAGLRLNPDHIAGATPDYNMLFSLDWKY